MSLGVHSAASYAADVLQWYLHLFNPLHLQVTATTSRIKQKLASVSTLSFGTCILAICLEAKLVHGLPGIG